MVRKKQNTYSSELNTFELLYNTETMVCFFFESQKNKIDLNNNNNGHFSSSHSLKTSRN